jgi:uncharacterized protein (DUF2062 family)
MLFKQRAKATLTERFRLWLWPRVSWRRSGSYYLKRTVRLAGPPHAIALGAAIGAAVSCTPLLGFHVAITLALAWLVRGNLIAGAVGTCLANPLTFPLIWAATYELGRLLLGTGSVDHKPPLSPDWAQRSFEQIWPVFKPMLVGSAPIGAAAGCVVYVVVYKAVAAYQRSRRERLADRHPPGPAASDGAEPLARTG